MKSSHRIIVWIRKKEITLVLLSFLILLIGMHYFLFDDAFYGDHIDSDVASKFGDFFGGYFGTLFTLISVLLLYFTLRSQQKASGREKFENKFFGLIELHKNNVNEIELGTKSGKKTFVLMIREFRELLIIVKEVTRILKVQLKEKELINLTYMTFFYGIGPNSSRILKASLPNFDKTLIEIIIRIIEEKKTRESIKKKRNFEFNPFGGHQSRLGHYFRHIYQTVKFVDGQKIDIEKYEYVKMLRAQLSNHEQALLFLNSLSYLGQTWVKENLINEYKLIKNLPKNFFDEIAEINPKQIYPKLIFEWEEFEVT